MQNIIKLWKPTAIQQEDFIEKDQLKKKGNEALAINDFYTAANYYHQVLKLGEVDAETYANLGLIYLKQKLYIESEMMLEKAIKIDPNFWKAYFNKALLFEEKGKKALAISACREILAKHSHYIKQHGWAEVHWKLMDMLIEEEFYHEAMDIIDALLINYPDWLELRCNKGVVLHRLRLDDKAIAYFEKMLEEKESGLVLSFIGAIHQSHGDLATAESYYKKAHFLDKDDAFAGMNYAQLFLLRGCYEEGWAIYDHSLKFLKEKDGREVGPAMFRRLFMPHKYWSGEDLSHKHLMIWTDQGLGDSIMMLRYAGFLKAHYPSCYIIFFCEQEMAKLAEQCKGIDEVWAKNMSDMTEIDYHCCTMSLPFLTKTTIETIPSTIPYLSFSPDKVNEWRQRLEGNTSFKVGIAWGGNKKLIHDKKRSIHLKQWMPLFEVEDISWFSLQKGDYADQLHEVTTPVIDWTEEFQDFEDTAAFMSQLDLIISVDTSVIHLAGAMGYKAWLFNRYNSEWRWLLDVDTSPWYPNIRIFRQDSLDSWSGTILKMRDELTKARISFYKNA